jgi:SAM-dependent methyltransferase
MTNTTQSAYREREARSYDQDREREPHWQREHDFVQALLSRRAPRRLLDAPIGTGRFLPVCPPSTRVAGLDLSAAMLEESQQRAQRLARGDLVLVRGSLTSLPFARATFDLSLCCRFMHLIPEHLLRPVFAELARVTAGRVCVQAYVRGPLRWRLCGRLIRVLRSERQSTEPWAHIAAYFHGESSLLSSASEAGLRFVSASSLGRYNATRVMMYEWDSG